MPRTNVTLWKFPKPTPPPQPPHVFSGIMPEVFLSQSTEWMFPASWHIRMNIIWGIQLWIMVLHCLWLRRWLPQQWASSRMLQDSEIGVDDVELQQLSTSNGESPRPVRLWSPPWTVWQFWIMLISHSVFYIIELDCTSITLKYIPMAYHHYLALVVFFAYASNVNTLSILALFPFVLHNLFWILGADNYTLLFWYNLCLALCGLVGMIVVIAFYALNRAGTASRNNSSSGVHQRFFSPISILLPLGTFAIASTNYYTYCRYY
ncbi:hypothetical protein BDR26DRAFT_856302, partial [Obelidium mucronatum]